MLLPLDRHYDFGLGAMGNAFKSAAESVEHAPMEHRDSLNEHLPISFLYRHAIELYFKSAIVIFHKKFRTPYGDVSFKGEPHTLVRGKWKPFTQVHSIGDLYPYFRHLFQRHSDFLQERTNTDWSFPTELDVWVAEVEALDSSSTYFRYPVTRHRDRDKDKSTMRPENYPDILSRMRPGDPPQKVFLLLNEDDEVQESYAYSSDAAKQAVEKLRLVCEHLSNCHAALRGELTGGM